MALSDREPQSPRPAGPGVATTRPTQKPRRERIAARSMSAENSCTPFANLIYITGLRDRADASGGGRPALSPETAQYLEPMENGKDRKARRIEKRKKSQTRAKAENIRAGA